jgi:hypothetical protein
VAQHSIWQAVFMIGASGPYTTFVGISGGSREDGQTPTTAAAIVSAITSNLLNILREMGNTALTAAPGGAVTLLSFRPGQIPDCWE